ncbi:hypothetical protein [Agarivorans sp. Alg241-V36]|uniref:hypothetical protein n=1 Tax=Agarivorans sp. Alg241-V36 TaxID=2305992 RepID=UPI0013D89FE5|nr:hypothetical protein [Agarivorans sp. Alg241-V36]
MLKLANRWAGKIYGTNTGNVFLELNQDESTLSGTLKIMDDIFGVSEYSCNGTISEGEITLCCEPSAMVEGMELGEVTILAFIKQDGRLTGDWSSEIGTAGTFNIFPHNLDDKQSKSDIPEQIFNKTISIGSLRLFKEDIINLISFMKKDFVEGRVIVTYSQRGSELTKFADDFLNDSDELNELNYFKAVVQEPEAHGINRVAVVELFVSGISEIRVSGINESWVLGKAESIYQTLKPKQNHFVTTYKKYGLNLNGIIFFSMLVVIPEIVTIENRAIFVLVVFLLLNILLFVHAKIIPNTLIYMQENKPNFFQRVWPTLVSWLVAASSSVAAAYIFMVLKGGN